MSHQQIRDSNVILRTSDNANIPEDANNRDWQEYQTWLADGNEPLPPEPISLDIRRSDALAKVLAKRDEELTKVVISNNKPFFADKDSMSLLNQTLSSQERGIAGIFPANWLLADGTVLSATYEDLKAVNELMAQRTAQNYGNYFSLVQQIITAENPENVYIDYGWSEV